MDGEQIYPKIPIPERDSDKNKGTEEFNGLPEKRGGLFIETEAEKGLSWPRFFGEGDPYDDISWEKRTAKIVKGNGEVVFEQSDVEVPDFWSQTATDIVASKYFRGCFGAPERETSARQIIDRVAVTIANWGWKDGYFKTKEDCENFKQDLKFILINQYAAFNSPVWFNVGVYERPQCSACFILSVEDSMESILNWFKNEGWIFKGGSGSGANLSKLRSSYEPLSKGGFSSGPVSFMKGADGVANTLRSGGTTRRAAKMVILNVDHPDIKSFIYSKKIIEDMTKILTASGVQNSIEGNIFDPYTLLPYQNANNSVRVNDDFMQKVLEDGDWELKAVTTGEVLENVKAKKVMNWIAEAAWASADPGMQYDTTINNWHTCPRSGRINASNPCAEYMSLDDSACNLASLNVLKFLQTDGKFNVDLFKKAVDVLILAQDIIIDNSSYPTEKITKNAKTFRQLGLGYANLGALIMSLGVPYDSNKGRTISGSITSLLCGQAYLMSAKIAKAKGPFEGYLENREPMLNVIRKHTEASSKLSQNIVDNNLMDDDGLRDSANNVWYEALKLGERFGYRNSQTALLAPTGTIAFLMDCATTGIEPELALVKYKKLVGGGMLKLVNNQIPDALRRLGYGDNQMKDINDYLLDNETIEGAPHIKEEHLPIFDCSFKALKGARSIHYMGHLGMMAATQPFISGAISKTVNLPNDAKVEDMYNAFVHAWKLGLKAVAFYRDGSKTVQPLATTKDEKLIERINGHTRVRLPDERPAMTHKFSIAGHEGYLTIGLYPDTKKPGETFIVIAKEGSTVSGLLNVIATLISTSLQSGVPLKTIVRKFKDMRFEPSGATNNPEIPFAKSFVDYIVRYMGLKFLNEEDQEEIFGVSNLNHQPFLGFNKASEESKSENKDDAKAALVSSSFMDAQMNIETDAPVCECGSIMNKAGSCYTCPNCFAITGVCN